MVITHLLTSILSIRRLLPNLNWIRYMAKQFNTNVGKARVSKKSRNGLEGCFTSMPLTHIRGHGHDCDMTQRFRLDCITPSSLGLALTLLCLRKEEAKLSCDSWRLIQQEDCWLVTGERTGIRSYSARHIRWQFGRKQLRAGMPRRKSNTKILNTNTHYYLQHQTFITWQYHCLPQ